MQGQKPVQHPACRIVMSGREIVDVITAVVAGMADVVDDDETT